jgi:hypothetical protein
MQLEANSTKMTIIIYQTQCHILANLDLHTFNQSMNKAVNIKIIFHLMDPTTLKSWIDEGCGQEGINPEAQLAGSRFKSQPGEKLWLPWISLSFSIPPKETVG